MCYQGVGNEGVAWKVRLGGTGGVKEINTLGDSYSGRWGES